MSSSSHFPFRKTESSVLTRTVTIHPTLNNLNCDAFVLILTDPRLIVTSPVLTSAEQILDLIHSVWIGALLLQPVYELLVWFVVCWDVDDGGGRNV